jgi:ATP-dependent protease ClpP protease subunit
MTKADDATPVPVDVGYTLDWSRAVYVNGPIDDDLVKQLTPIILRLKQDNADPITVAIDSPGGKMSSLEALLGLLKSPDQDGRRISIYTIATNKAHSAAANLLAFGDYAVAFPHSDILYHDFRYEALEDVTPSKALQTARGLEKWSETFSLKVATQVAERLVWSYIDLQDKFPKSRTYFADWLAKNEAMWMKLIPSEAQKGIDLLGFVLTLYRYCTRAIGRDVVFKALNRLQKFLLIERTEIAILSLAGSDGKVVDFLAGIKSLYAKAVQERGGSSQESPSQTTSAGKLSDNVESEIRLLMELLIHKISDDPGWSLGNNQLDVICQEFTFILMMRDPSHVGAITKFMTDHPYIFLDPQRAEEYERATDDDQKKEILESIYPQAKLLWYYIVVLCQCLYEGDHSLAPYDAQLLGIVDEVLGGGPIESSREYRCRMRREEAQKEQPATKDGQAP